MENLGYYRGEYGPLETMKVDMNDRASFFGDGVYDATYVSEHKIFSLGEHIDRFFRSAKLLKLPLQFTKEELAQLLRDMVSKVDGSELMLYWQATRGTALRKHEFPVPEVPANLWITIKPGKLRDFSQPMKLITVEDTRYLHCNIKTLNLLPNVMAAQQAAESGCDEVAFHRNGRVTEGAHSNLSILKDGVFMTAPLDNLILPGITRGQLIGVCRENSIPVAEVPFSVDELMNADEVIMSSCGCLCIPVSQIDMVNVGGKAPELLKTIQEGMRKVFEKETV